MTTLFTYSPAHEHFLQGHPERPERVTAIQSLLRRHHVLYDVEQLEPAPATDVQLRRAHHPEMLEFERYVSLRGGGMIDRDTYATAESFDLAKLAAGSCIEAVDQIMQKRADNGFVCVRPPGHHAEYRRPGGFCLINNVAVAAHHLLSVYKQQRIMILDFDVHHGNGTQDIFYHDDRILFFSIHQYGSFFYPGSGGLEEIGTENARGFTLNVPLQGGIGDLGYELIFDKVVWPRARRFKPDFILISAGYDAHWADPLAMVNLTLRGFGWIAQQLVLMADELCQGRLLCVLEGGYLLDAVSHGVLNTVYALLKKDLILDPLGPSPEPEPNVTKLLSDLLALHLIK